MGFVVRLALAALPTAIRLSAGTLFLAWALALAVPGTLALGITAAISLAPATPGSFSPRSLSLRSCSVSLWHATHLLLK